MSPLWDAVRLVDRDHGYIEIAAYSEKSGIQMTCFTDMPGLQFYTANKLNEEGGKNNIPLKPQNGFCMETQFFPDSPNHPEFPSAVIKKQSEFVSKTIYQFKDRDEIW